MAFDVRLLFPAPFSPLIRSTPRLSRRSVSFAIERKFSIFISRNSTLSSLQDLVAHLEEVLPQVVLLCKAGEQGLDVADLVLLHTQWDMHVIPCGDLEIVPPHVLRPGANLVHLRHRHVADADELVW